MSRRSLLVVELLTADDVVAGADHHVPGLVK
jgi:hypothetical protein